MLGWVNLACHIVEVVHGFGRHEFYLSLSSVAINGKFEYIAQIHNVLSVTFTKVSAALFLLRVLARGTTKRTKWPLYILMALFVTIAVVTIVADSVQCIPLSASWDPRAKGKCLHPHQVVAFGYALGGERFPVADSARITLKQDLPYLLTWFVLLFLSTSSRSSR